MAEKKKTAQKRQAKVFLGYGTGRRKASIARVFIKKGTGTIQVNGRPLEAYFPGETDWADQVRMPLKVIDGLEQFDVIATVKGGGLTGQAGALRLGLARALDRHELDLLGLTIEQVREAQASNQIELPERPWRRTLRAAGYLTRDARIVQRKLVGLVKARKAKQFSKR